MVVSQSLIPDAFLAEIVNSSNDAILTKDLHSRITFWNKGAERVFGYTAEEALGQPVTLLFPPDRYDEEPVILGRIQRGEHIEHYETVRRRNDGTLIIVSLTVSPIRDAQGNIIGASKIARDITPQRIEQEQYRITLASIADAVVAADLDGKITFTNTAAEKLMGYQRQELIGKRFEDVMKVRDAVTGKSVEHLIQDLSLEGSALNSDFELLARDGTRIAIEKRASPIRLENNQRLGTVFVFRDIRERRSSEIALARLAAIIENSDDAIISKNLQGIVTSWNAAAERLFGYNEKEMIGESIVKLLPLDRRFEEENILSRLQKGERVDHFQTTRRRKDGEMVDVSLTISPIRNKNGTIVGASKIARDITTLRQAQRTLEQHAQELEHKVLERTTKLQEMVRELESFSYSLSHDMRAPIRAIHSFAEIALETSGEQLGKNRQYIERIIKSAERMDRLILDVLSFARMSREQIELHPIEVERLVREIIAERPELSRAGVEIESPLVNVIGHEASLTQCLTNLMDNAVKFVRPGAGPKVVVSSEVHGDRVRLCVRDNGIGIEPAAQRRLFSLFQRVADPTQYEGTGVGLAIVRKSAERMNGSAGVQSLPDQGSTFWVELEKA